MQVFVNEKPLEFQLEQTIPLNQVLDHVQDWANKQNYYILDYQVKTKKPGKTEQEASSNDIDTLNIKVGSQRDLILENLQEINAYLDKIGTFLAEKASLEKEVDKAAAREISEGIGWMSDSINSIEKQLNLTPNEELKHALEELSKHDVSKNTLDAIENLAVIKDRVYLWMKNGKYSDLTDDERSELSQQFIEQLPRVLKELESAASDLTTGKESSALQTLERSIDFLSDGIAIINQIEKYQKVNQDLVKLLAELTDSLQEQDLVTAADIVDFDLKEAIEKILAV